MSKSPKLKPIPRPLFSCGIFRNCTQSVLSPTASSAPPPPPSSSSSILPPPPSPPPLPPPPPPPAPSSDQQQRQQQQQRPHPSSSSSSSSSTSPSFTQWRFPLHHDSTYSQNAPPPPLPPDVFGAAERQFRCEAPLTALKMLEKSLGSDQHNGSGSVCSREVMAGVVAALREPSSARPAAKVLLALLLVESNRQLAVEAGAAAAAVEAIASAAGSTAATSAAERALAALELMCTTDQGLAAVRDHALVGPAMAGAVQAMQGRGRECAIGVLAAVYGGSMAREAPEEAVMAVMVAMQGECSARGRRKGAGLLRALQECGRLDMDLNFDG